MGKETLPPSPASSPPVRAAWAMKATDTWGPARLSAVTCSHRLQGGEGSNRRQDSVGPVQVSTFWKLLGRVAPPTVRRTGQPGLPLDTQPCSSSRSSWVYSGTKILHRVVSPQALRLLHPISWASSLLPSRTPRPRTQGLGPCRPRSCPGPTHSLEVVGVGEESLWKGHIGL